MADADVAIAEPGPRTWPYRVEPQLEQEPPSEVSGDSRTVHRFKVLGAQTVHGPSERSFDAPQPVGLQGFELLIREALPASESVHMVDLHVAKRPMVRQAVNSVERQSSEAIIQGLDDRLGSVAEVGGRRRRGFSAGQALKADRTDRHLSAVDSDRRRRYPAGGRPVPIPEVASLKRCVLAIHQDRDRRPFHLGRARNWTVLAPSGEGNLTPGDAR